MIWLKPKVLSQRDAHLEAEGKLTQAERDLREWQRRAIGYVESLRMGPALKHPPPQLEIAAPQVRSRASNTPML